MLVRLPMRIVLIVMLALLVLVPAAAQTDLTELYIAEGGVFAFNYPPGWDASGSGDTAQLTSDPAGLSVGFFGPSLLTINLTDDEAGAVDVLDAVKGNFGISGTAEALTIGEREGAIISVESDELVGIAIVLPISETDYGLMIATSVEGDFSPYATIVLDIARTFDAPPPGSIVGGGDLPPNLENYNGLWSDVIAELEAQKVIGLGGSLVFVQDLAFFDGQGNWFTSLAQQMPYTNIVMAAELTYTVGSTDSYETCGLMARTETNNAGTATRYLEVGFDNDNDLYFRDKFGTDNTISDYVALDLDFEQPHHLLFIVNGNALTIYLDGELMVENYQITERPGFYGLSLRGQGPESACEGSNIWVYQTPVFEAGVCNILTYQVTNERTGPGTNFELINELEVGSTRRVVGQTTGEDGYRWWSLEDGYWVREDVVVVQGDCLSMPEVED